MNKFENAIFTYKTLIKLYHSRNLLQD